MENISNVLSLLNTKILGSLYGIISFYNHKTIVMLLDFMLKDSSKSFLVTNWKKEVSFFKQNMINKWLFLNLDSLGVDVRISCELSIP